MYHLIPSDDAFLKFIFFNLYVSNEKGPILVGLLKNLHFIDLPESEQNIFGSMCVIPITQRARDEIWSTFGSNPFTGCLFVCFALCVWTG